MKCVVFVFLFFAFYYKPYRTCTLYIYNIADVQNSYKYLGIPQVTGNHEKASRKSATATVHVPMYSKYLKVS